MYHDSDELVSHCQNVSQYNYEVNFGTCGMGSERVFNKKVCFIDPNDFREDLHGVKATDDPLYLGEARFGKREKRTVGKTASKNTLTDITTSGASTIGIGRKKGRFFNFAAVIGTATSTRRLRLRTRKN